ncbi:MAG: peptide chain release factor N(5)-glutamine methyltransferase [Clostridiales bacterium]|nr:peptide chain release factor N(5)-glutamine methyltransferase [Clostridiales bacterium]MBP3265844.1 peptide chain release factor N(5)-glutamine methyltransferase [Clostridiales bacterium]MBP3809798.1 peptide chain release factor N(5)-glutamine methyltransferase [Clostridiales bacterium]
MSGNINKAIEVLTEAGIDHEDARFDIGVLFTEFGEDGKAFDEAVMKRAAGVPVAYIVGRQPFYREEYKVTPSVLIPRADTELLVETALRFLGALDLAAGDVNLVPESAEPLTSPRILDLCTGTGCVGISVLNSLLAKGIRAQAVLADISDEALAIARENIESQAADKSAVKAIKLDVLSEDLPEDLGSFDVITANPPYINSVDMKALDKEVKDHEPHLALAGGEDGLDFYLPICKLSHKCLRQGGMLAVEHGYDQAEGVSQTLMAQGFNIVKSLKDFGNNDRVTFGIKLGGEVHAG